VRIQAQSPSVFSATLPISKESVNSGTSGFATYEGGAKAGNVISDNEDLVALMKEWNAKEEYEHRTTALRLTELGKEKGVKTYVIVPPTIYGTSSGFIPRLSVQLPPLIRDAIQTKIAHYIGPGTAVWSNVHILDLAGLYLLILRCALSGLAKEGEEGYYFASNGEKSWKELAVGIKMALEENESFEGQVKVESWEVADAAKLDGVTSERDAKLAFASNVVTSPDKSLALGWTPKFGGDSIFISIKNDAAIILDQLKSNQ